MRDFFASVAVPKMSIGLPTVRYRSYVLTFVFKTVVV